MSARRETWAIFGGSFDPPHVSHVLAAAFVLATSDVDRVVVVPAFRHPLDKIAQASFEHRVAMCTLAMADLRRVEVSTIEAELGGASRTLRTLEALAGRAPSPRLRLVLGRDLVEELPRWHRVDDVLRLAPPLFVDRAGAPGAERAPLPPISSTDVRARLATGADVAALLPRRVLEYVRAHGLYGASP